MAARKSNRNVVLMDGLTVSANGAQTATSFFPPHNLNPRFQLKVSGLTGPGARIAIEHSEVEGEWSELFSEFVVDADGTYQARAEDLYTRFPFTRVRAVVRDYVSGSFVATLVGVCDKL